MSSKSTLPDCQISVSCQCVPQLCPVENVISIAFLPQQTCQHSGSWVSSCSFVARTHFKGPVTECHEKEANVAVIAIWIKASQGSDLLNSGIWQQYHYCSSVHALFNQIRSDSQPALEILLAQNSEPIPIPSYTRQGLITQRDHRFQTLGPLSHGWLELTSRARAEAWAQTRSKTGRKTRRQDMTRHMRSLVLALTLRSSGDKSCMKHSETLQSDEQAKKWLSSAASPHAWITYIL